MSLDSFTTLTLFLMPMIFCIQEDIPHIITEHNLHMAIEGEPVFFIFAYRTNCEQCEQAIQIAHALYPQLQETKIHGNFGFLNVEELQNVDWLRTFPAFPIFRAVVRRTAYFVDYEGPMILEEIYAWISGIWKNRKAPKEISSAEEAKRIERMDLAAFYRVPAGDNASQDLYEALQTLTPHIDFYLNTDYPNNRFEPLIEDSQDPYCFVLVRSFDDGPKVICSQSPFNFDILHKVLAFFASSSFELLDESLAFKILNNKVPTMFMFHAGKEAAKLQHFKNFSLHHKGQIKFVISTLEGQANEAIAELFSVTRASLPMVAIIDFDKNTLVKYRSSEITPDALTRFFTEYKAGTLARFYKSEPVSGGKKSSLLQLISANFEEAIANAKSHVLVLFTDGKCANCAEATDSLAEAAKNLADIKSVVFAIFNTSLSSVPADRALAIGNLPSIVLFTRGAKDDPVKYYGEYTWEDIGSFVNKMTGQLLFENLPSNETKGHSEHFGVDNFSEEL